jgi:hypothetical protein
LRGQTVRTVRLIDGQILNQARRDFPLRTEEPLVELDGPRKEDVVLEVHVLEQVRLEFLQLPEAHPVGRAGIVVSPEP